MPYKSVCEGASLLAICLTHTRVPGRESRTHRLDIVYHPRHGRNCVEAVELFQLIASSFFTKARSDRVLTPLSDQISVDRLPEGYCGGTVDRVRNMIACQGYAGRGSWRMGAQQTRDDDSNDNESMG